LFREVLRLCRQRLEYLHLPPGASPGEVIDLLSQRRGRPLHIFETERPVGFCGVWVSSAERDVIYIDADAQGVRRTHILLHELAHVAMDHDDGGSVLDPAVARTLFPDLDPATVRAVLGRDAYTSEEEQQAEVLAWMLQEPAQDMEPLPDGSNDGLLTAAFNARR